MSKSPLDSTKPNDNSSLPGAYIAGTVAIFFVTIFLLIIVFKDRIKEYIKKHQKVEEKSEKKEDKPEKKEPPQPDLLKDIKDLDNPEDDK